MSPGLILALQWWIIDTSLALAVATDVGIALALTYYLHTSRSGVTRYVIDVMARNILH